MLNSLAQALDLSAEVLLDQAGLLRDVRDRDLAVEEAAEAAAPPVKEGRGRDPGSSMLAAETAIRADDRLSAVQKRALLAVYRSYVAADSTRDLETDG